jgi:hypothetical protein
MLRRIALLVIVTTLVASGCTHVSVRSFPVDPNSKELLTGQVYALPKALFKLTVPYSLVQRRSISTGALVGKPRLVVSKPITLEEIYVADLCNVFVLDISDATESACYKSDLSFTTSDAGFLVSGAATLEHRGPEIAEAFVSTSIALARSLVTVMELVEAESTEWAVLEERSVTILLDPGQDFEKPAGAAEYVHNVPPPAGLFEGVSDVPEVQLRYCCADSPRQNAGSVLNAQCEPGQCAYVDGIVCRSPFPVRVEVLVNSVPVLQQVVNIPQFSRPMVLAIHDQGPAERKTALALSTTAGTLLTYGLTTESAAEQVALAAAHSADAVDKAMVDVLYGRRLEVLEKQMATQNARASLAGESALEKLSRRLDSLQTLIGELVKSRKATASAPNEQSAQPK